MEVNTMVKALAQTGVSSVLRFNPVGETGRELVRFLTENDSKPIGGEAVLRIDNRYVYS